MMYCPLMPPNNNNKMPPVYVINSYGILACGESETDRLLRTCSVERPVAHKFHCV